MCEHCTGGGGKKVVPELSTGPAPRISKRMSDSCAILLRGTSLGNF